jgi:carotenoid cleavage dioxygenase-like enzyme
MIVTRQELTDEVLPVLEGKIPDDLKGHWLAMGPTGNVAMTPPPGEPSYPSSDGTSLFNGDAMAHRFDCDRPGEVRLTTRILKTPCYYADRATTLGSRHGDLKFVNLGLGRYSFSLGFRNEVNTAAIPVKFAGDDRWRLLVAWDAGRPYEIDPVSLEVKTPIGSNTEWRGQELPLKTTPFELHTTATHHAYDDRTQDLYTVNFGKSLLTMGAPVLVYGVTALVRWTVLFKRVLHWAFRILIKVLQCISLLLYPLGFSQDFVYLLQWDGHGPLHRWQVMLPRTLGLPIRRPVQIEQSMHQVGVTQRFVVLMDTSFKLGPQQLIPNPLPGNTDTERVLREVLNYPQLPETNVYLVNREDLTDDRKTVIAQQIKIPREIAHFRVDYDDSDGVVLHVAHNNGWDPSEWPQAYDSYVHTPAPPQPIQDPIQRLVGMTVSTTDLNYLARYVIDPNQGKVVQQDLVSDRTCTWAPAIYADVGNTGVIDRYDHIYWIAWGCWDELMPQFVVDRYKKHKYRQLPIQDVLEAATGQAPPALCHLDTTTMQIVDKYLFPPGHFGNSPQFIPRGDNTDQTYGYLACVVLLDKDAGPTSEIWLFDAQNLEQGPICKLGFPTQAAPAGQTAVPFQMGLTIHTTWVPEIAPRTASYHVPVQADYDPLLVNEPEAIRRFFKEEVYPHFQ